VIRLTRLNSQQITVNSDLIKLVESNPDTVLTLVSGDKVLVHETAEEVVARVIEFKRAVLAGLLTANLDPAGAVTAAGRTQWDRSSLSHAEDKSRG
jgi:flagellar protein FlbD